MKPIEAFENDFSKNCTQTLAKQILLGTETYNRFFHDNREFFSYPRYNSVRGALLTYSIQQTLSNSAFVPNSLYQAKEEIVNNYGYSVLQIRTENFRVTTAKTQKWTHLPAPSEYKRRYASANAGGDGQLVFDFVDNCITSDPYYALLTYGYNMKTNECTHIDLVLPDSSFNQILDRKDLLPNDNCSLYLIPSESEVDDNVVALNSEFENIVRLKTKEKGV